MVLRLASAPSGELSLAWTSPRLARVLTQIPEPRKHGIHYFGAYSSKARAHRVKRKLTLQSFGDKNTHDAQDEPSLSPQNRAVLTRNWARLIRRVYLVDPLKCNCGGTFRVIAFITDDKAIRKILSHLKTRTTDARAPP